MHAKGARKPSGRSPVPRRRTKTSAFGSPGRTSHDSSSFYAGRLYPQAAADGAPTTEAAVPASHLDRILCRSSERMTGLPDRSIHLMVTSPPYNAGKEYDQDLTLEEYRRLLRSAFTETYRVLVGGGRACVNLANLGRKPYIPLHAFIVQDLLEIGFLMRGEIIWNKAGSASPSTAWGSWRSATNPVLRDIHEYILVFSKESFARPGQGRQSSLSRDDFLEWTKSVWTFPPVSARSVGHPAPFPEELPRRLIELYTFRDDVVLDPFCGSGTTCMAAKRLGRHYIGYDVDKDYTALARRRLAQVRA
jgi:site-specific DNA-methyltransferase (adenine-specific)